MSQQALEISRIKNFDIDDGSPVKKNNKNSSINWFHIDCIFKSTKILMNSQFAGGKQVDGFESL